MAVVDDKSVSLRREAIGLREVLFQSVTHMAPAAAVAFNASNGLPAIARSTFKPYSSAPLFLLNKARISMRIPRAFQEKLGNSSKLSNFTRKRSLGKMSSANFKSEDCF